MPGCRNRLCRLAFVVVVAVAVTVGIDVAAAVDVIISSGPGRPLQEGPRCTLNYL